MSVKKYSWQLGRDSRRVRLLVYMSERFENLTGRDLQRNLLILQPCFSCNLFVDSASHQQVSSANRNGRNKIAEEEWYDNVWLSKSLLRYFGSDAWIFSLTFTAIKLLGAPYQYVFEQQFLWSKLSAPQLQPWWPAFFRNIKPQFQKCFNSDAKPI